MRGETVLEAGRAQQNYWRDVYAFRELLLILAWRDIAVRYKQTMVGIAWAIVRPAATVLIFTIVFSKIAKVSTAGELPYGLIVLVGTLPWFAIASIIQDGSQSVLNSGNLITKVYFPRIIVPLAATGVALVDFSINFVLVLVVLALNGVLPGVNCFALPLVLAWLIVVGAGPALLFSALSVRYRDVRFVVPFLVQLGLYASPIAYSTAAVPESWRLLFGLNPVAGVVEGFRWCLLGGDFAIPAPSLAGAVFLSLGVLLAGIAVFRRSEKAFPDLV